MSKRTDARWGGMGAIGLLVVLLVAAPAHATTYCVPDATGCPGGAVASPTVQSALDSAEAAGNDTVLIKPGNYNGNFVYDPSVSNAGQLEVGAQTGTGVTLRPIGSGGTTLLIDRDSSDSLTTVRDLTIEAPDGGSGLITYGNALRGQFRGVSGAQGATGMRLIGSTEAKDVDVRMADNGGPSNRGIETTRTSGNEAGPSTITTSYVESEEALLLTNGASVRRTRVVSSQNGINVLCAGTVVIDNVAHTVTGGFGLRAHTGGQCGPENPASVDVRHLTLVSEAPSAGPALWVEAVDGGNAQIVMRSSIVLGFANVVRVQQGNQVGTTTSIQAGHSLVDLTLGDPQYPGSFATDLGGNFTGDPLFRDAPARDYRQLWHSPVIDAGHPLPLGPGESTTDLLGTPRLFDGDGDGVQRRDAGAFEYDAAAPKVSVSPNPAVVGQPITFDASQSHSIYGPREYAWTWDDGGSAGDSASVTHTFSTPGTHTGTLSMGDNSGNPNAVQPFSVVVNAAPTTSPPPAEPQQQPSNPLGPVNPSGSQGTVVADTAAPSLTAKLVKKRFSRKKGGSLRLQLSEAATVSVLVERCTKRKGRRCTRYRRASLKSVESSAGNSRVALKGLRTGLHRVRVRASDAAGNRSAQRTATFTVTR
jgi:PKD repeat protein